MEATHFLTRDLTRSITKHETTDGCYQTHEDGDEGDLLRVGWLGVGRGARVARLLESGGILPLLLSTFEKRHGGWAKKGKERVEVRWVMVGRGEEGGGMK